MHRGIFAGLAVGRNASGNATHRVTTTSGVPTAARTAVVKRLLLILVWAALLAACHPAVKAPRIEIAPISDLNAIGATIQAAPKPVLLVLDIDDTLLSTLPRDGSRAFFGSDRWYQWQAKLAAGDKSKIPTSCLFNLLEWNAELDKLSATQPNGPSAINGITVDKLILTSRSANSRVGTERELASAQYTAIPDLRKIDPRRPVWVLPGDHGPMTYANGILMTGGTRKGPALARLLEALDLQAKYRSIVMADDGQANLDSVQQQLAGGSIEFHGLRYTGIKGDPFDGPSPREVSDADAAWTNWRDFLERTFPERKAWVDHGCK